MSCCPTSMCVWINVLRRFKLPFDDVDGDVMAVFCTDSVGAVGSVDCGEGSEAGVDVASEDDRRVENCSASCLKGGEVCWCSARNRLRL